jgi:hypothetical protein
MAIGATRSVGAELARLDLAAEGAGSALACVHQTAEEFHRALIRRYRALHPRRHWPCIAMLVIAGFLLLI